MIKKPLSSYESQAGVFKALAHPARLFIVHQIADEEKCVCEIVKTLDLDTSTVSKHLAVLRNAGIVKDEKRGNMVFYRIRMDCVLDLFACVNKALESQTRERLEAVTD